MRQVTLQFTRAIIFCSLASLAFAADTLIYNNSTYSSSYYPPGSSTEIVDYGTSPGGTVSKFKIRYYTSLSNPGTIIIRFYDYVSSSYLGYPIKTFYLSGLSGGGAFTKEYIIPEQDRFNLNSGNFGYSYEFSNSSTGAVIASGGTGSDTYFWQYDPLWEDFLLTYFTNGWGGFYMQVYKGPSINEITCDISGYKFNDTNGNGVWNTGEAALPGWDIYLDTDNDGIHDASEPNAATDPNGFYFFENKASPATYRVREILKTGWTQTLPGSAGSYQYVIATEPNHIYGPYNFGNIVQLFNSSISGSVFYDSNGNSVRDGGESGQANWRVYIDTNGNDHYNAGEPTALTNASGNYQITGLATGVYRVAEEMLEGWVQTYPTTACIHTVTISTSGQAVSGINFGNHTFSNYGGGSGTLASPYLIYTHLHLQAVGAHNWDWDKYFKLMDNIDLSKYNGEQFNMIGRYHWTTSYDSFNGVFDGNGHTIYNFTYNYTGSSQACIGLFGYVWNGEIRNLLMENISILTQGEGVDNAALVGNLEGDSIILNCHIENANITVTSDWSATGLIGNIRAGTVSNCSVTQSVISGGSWSGGIAGNNYDGSIYDCSFEGTVTGHQNVGGIVGDNQSTISRCYANAVVDGFQQVGGLSGGNSGDAVISKCFSQGTVLTHTDPVYGLAGNEAGGLVGRNSNGNIINCYSLADVSSVQKVGGLVATTSADSLGSCEITNCYAAGSVSGSSTVGGLIGWDIDELTSVNNCFWDKQTTGRTYSDGGTGLLTADMQNKQTYLTAGWDFVNETANGTEDFWQLCDDTNEYPKLAWNTPPCGSAQLILYPVADVYVKSSEPDTNFGASTSLMAGKSGTTIYRSFLKFDMSQVPDGYQIVSAKLQLQANYIPLVSIEIGAWQTYEGWTESQITWNNQKSAYDTLPVDTCIVSTGTNSWDVTQDADDTYCYDRELSILLQSTNESLAYYTGFWSKEIIGSSIPRLLVTYVPILGGGKGTPDDPFQIWTAQQMNTVGLLTNRYDQSYKLMADISMADYTGALYNQIGTWSSTVSLRVPFKGVFDGNGHTISNFHAGALFDYVNAGRIMNLGLIAPVISDNGAFADHLEGSDISDCWVNGGSVSGSTYVGGLVGYFSISNMGGCWSSATVSGSDDVGGLIGNSAGLGHIQNCYAAGNVSGQNRVGGFIGTAYDSSIIDCYSTGTVTGTTDAGGFCGLATHYYFTQDIAYNCFWDSQTSGKTTSALGTPKTTAEMKMLSTFTDAGWDFVSETINGRNDDWALPAGSYPVLWYQLSTPPSLPSFAGGNGTQTTPYLIATVDQLNSIGHNQRLMNKHFRLTNDLDLAGQSFTMIADGAYAFMGTFDGNSHTIKNTNISIPMYHGNIGFVGYNYGGRLLNLTLRNADVQAAYTHNVGSLVGLNRTGHIQNCHSQNLDLTGFLQVGGLVGCNYWHAAISECSVSGRVEESSVTPILLSCVGGLVGENSWWSTIEYSGVNTDVFGEETVGGLVGYNIIFAQLTDCYAIGTVNATDDYTGGLVGRSSGTNIHTRCYAACNIAVPADAIRAGVLAGYGSGGTYTDCFWDSQINGALPGFGYTGTGTVLIDTVGETTTNMRMASIYQAQSWDFANVWRICEGMNTPRLQSEPKLPGDFECPDGVGMEDFPQLAKCWNSAIQLQADIYSDMQIDLADVAALGTYWMQIGCSACGGSDISGDGNVNMTDLEILIDEWMLHEIPECSVAELSGDNMIDIADLMAFCDNWLLDR
jgi:hypothetical protein